MSICYNVNYHCSLCLNVPSRRGISVWSLHVFLVSVSSHSLKACRSGSSKLSEGMNVSVNVCLCICASPVIRNYNSYEWETCLQINNAYSDFLKVKVLQQHKK